MPDKWKANCYVFALAPKFGIKGGFYKNRTQKARPGDKCPEWANKDFDFNSCADFVDRIICDNKQLVKKIPNTMYNSIVEEGSHLFAAILASKGHTDFHFLRRVPIESIIDKWTYFRNQMMRSEKANVIAKFEKVRREWEAKGKPTLFLWIHQRGWSSGGPVIYDAKDNLIFNPQTANYNYGDLHYNKFCGLFKAVSRQATVTSKYNYNS